MFERLTERARRAAEAGAGRAARALAERLESELPPGIRAEATGEGVALRGRGLRRRFALDPALRGLLGRGR